MPCLITFLNARCISKYLQKCKETVQNICMQAMFFKIAMKQFLCNHQKMFKSFIFYDYMEMA